MTTLPKIPLHLTGFGSFPGVSSNPTELILEQLNTVLATTPQDSATLVSWQKHLSVSTELLPVTYRGAPRQVLRTAQQSKPSILLHLGVAAKDHTIRLETRAINTMSASIPDNDGVQYINHAIEEVMPLCHEYQTTVDVDSLLVHLQQQGVSSRLSSDAGQYVCNSLYYHSLLWSKEEHPSPQSLFVHIPPVGSVSEEGHEWTLESLQVAVEEILNWFGEQSV